MKLSIQVEVTEKERRLLCENSLERVLNTALAINQDLDAANKHEDGFINSDDLESLSPLASRIWYAAGQSVVAMSAKAEGER